MLIRLGLHATSLCVLATMLTAAATCTSTGSWSGMVRDHTGGPIAGVTITLHSQSSNTTYSATTSADGKFGFPEILAGSYDVSARRSQEEWRLSTPVVIKDGPAFPATLQLSSLSHDLRLESKLEETTPQASRGEHLSGAEVSNLPLNARDFSKLLLLAAGTMTDANGAANFTQQFAVNGQRGFATVFAMDGFDTTDSELGGATFSNFNVDAIQEVQGNSGVMPAEIGHGAASFTNVITKSGVNQIHGSVFEFIRNAAFDARNYFDHNVPGGRRIPPFVRNEFGFTNGGPIVIPGIYDGRDRTYYFGEYQGFRQVLGTTQVFPVPTAAER
jgi:hypothetical protein